MSFPVPTFWKLAIDSQLFTPAECKKLGEKFTLKKGSDDVGVLTAWLISRGALSRYQGEVLLAGRAGPFVYGDYKIYDRVESKRFARMFCPQHVPTKQRVCLYFLRGLRAARSRYRPCAIGPTGSAGQSGQHGFSAFAADVRIRRPARLQGRRPRRHMQGKRLERVLSKGKPLSPGRSAVDMLRQAALGLARLYALGLVHGEVRPANMWLDPNGVVKLIHFPLSRDPLSEAGSAEITRVRAR